MATANFTTKPLMPVLNEMKLSGMYDLAFSVLHIFWPT